TFLFVVMLAQPEGHAVYDRISWGLFPKITSVAMAGIFDVVLTFALLRSPPTSLRWQVARATSQLVASDGTRLLRDDQLVSARHAVTPGEPGTLRLVLRLDEPTLTQRRPEIERQLPVALAQAAPEL